MFVSCSSQHHAIDLLQMCLRCGEVGNAAIEDNLQLRKGSLEAVDPGIVQRRYFPIFARAQTL